MRQSSTFLLILCAALLAGCNLRAGNVTDTPVPTLDAPQVRFAYPENNSSVFEGTDLTLEVAAQDSGVGISRVELLIDDVPHDQAAPENNTPVPAFVVRFNWLAEGLGKHAITAIAYRADDRPSPPVTIVVDVIPRPEATESP